MRRRRPVISSLLATGRPAARRRRTAPQTGDVNGLRLSIRATDAGHDGAATDDRGPTTASAIDDAGSLACQISAVQRAAGQLRMAEAVLDQVALHLVEMEAFIAPTHESSIDAQWRRQGISNSIAQLQAALDVARVNGRKLFSGTFAIEASASGATVSLDLPAIDAATLGDPRTGTIATLVELCDRGGTVLSVAQAQVAAQKARVCACATSIGEMIQSLEIALEMHAAAGTTIADDEFAQAVAQTTKVDVFMAASATASNGRNSTIQRLRIHRDAH